MKQTPSDIDVIVRRVMSRLLGEPSHHEARGPVQSTGGDCDGRNKEVRLTAEAVADAVGEAASREMRHGGRQPASAYERAAAPEIIRSGATQGQGPSHGGCSCGCREGQSTTANRTFESVVSVDSTTAVLSQRVVAAADVESLDNRVRKLIVAARSVVTPSARDALRDRGIELLREDAPSRNASTGQPTVCDKAADLGLVGRSLRLNITVVCDYDPQRQRTDIVDVRTTIEPTGATAEMHSEGGAIALPGTASTSEGPLRGATASVLNRPAPEVLRSATTRHIVRPR